MSSSRRTVALRVLRQDEFNFDAPDDSPLPERPRTRADCVDGPRPCPFATCIYHLFVDIRMDGSLRINADAIENMANTCALDVADEGPHTLEQVAEMLTLKRERVRQIEVGAMTKLEDHGVLWEYEEHRTTTYDEAELWADVSASEVYFEEEVAAVDGVEAWAERVIGHVEDGMGLAEAWGKASEEE